MAHLPFQTTSKTFRLFIFMKSNNNVIFFTPEVLWLVVFCTNYYVFFHADSPQGNDFSLTQWDIHVLQKKNGNRTTLGDVWFNKWIGITYIIFSFFPLSYNLTLIKQRKDERWCKSKNDKDGRSDASTVFCIIHFTCYLVLFLPFLHGYSWEFASSQNPNA